MKYKSSQIIFLTLIITGAITFIYSMIFWDESLLVLSLLQMGSGSLGFYIIENYLPPKYPPYLKREKD
ncbi:hypothetical protein LCGC14_1954800 [marine sediment metagenome]|uniref:Uncharacterized protein n=1 Tax=marine sediment metagenome TaxID=412755 RepID=A0A0F9IDH6_9ZZZZ